MTAAEFLDQPPPKNDLDYLNLQLRRLEDRLVYLSNRLDWLAATTDAVSNDANNLKLTQQRDPTDTYHRLDTSGASFIPCSTKIGTLLVACDSVGQTPVGYKFQLRVGNPLNIELSNLHWAAIWWSDSNGQHLGDKREGKWVNAFPGGKWTAVDLTLECTSADLTNVMINLSSDTVALFGRP